MKYHLNKTSHPDIINCMQHGAYKIIYDETDGICVYDKANELYYADANNYQAAQTIINEAGHRKHDLVIRGESLKHVCTTERLMLSKPYRFAVYMESIPQILPETDYTIRRLTMEALPYICAHYSYKSLANPQYIEARIKAGMLGAFQDHQLIAFIGTHDCGSIGMLEVEREHQRNKVGTCLTIEMINLQLEKGLIPYGELFIDNQKSRSMALKLKLKLSKDLIYWAYMNNDES